MARRLKTIAREINETIPGLRARIEKGWRNRLIVTRGATTVLYHNAAYLPNDEVEDWLERWRAGKCTGVCFGNTHSERCRLAGQRKKR